MSVAVINSVLSILNPDIPDRKVFLFQPVSACAFHSHPRVYTVKTFMAVINSVMLILNPDIPDRNCFLNFKKWV
jgi:hypothetical protein